MLNRIVLLVVRIIALSEHHFWHLYRKQTIEYGYMNLIILIQYERRKIQRLSDGNF